VPLNVAERDIDPSAVIAGSSRVVADRLRMEAGAKIGEDVQIVGGDIHVGPGAEIRAGARITAIEGLELGAGSVLGPGLKASARRLTFGADFWSTNRVLIGGGGWQGPDSILTVGDSTSFFDGAFVNVSEHVDMGSGCALSADTTVLTHGCWQPVLAGYPSLFAPVVFGNEVVVFIKSSVLPGVTLGEGTTVAAGSVVIKDTPPFSLVGGVPARVIKTDVRRQLTADDRRDLVCATLVRYVQTLDWKGVEVLDRAADGSNFRAGHAGVEVTVRVADDAPLRIHVEGAPEGSTVIDLDAMTFSGGASPLAEDLRGFLRRSGMKIVTDRPFRSLPPAQLTRLESMGREATSG